MVSLQVEMTEPTVLAHATNKEPTSLEHYDKDPEQINDDPDDTEDDEVKLNCVGGSSGLEDSDLSSDSEDDSGASTLEKEDRDAGVVEFVSVKLQRAGNCPPIRRPKPVLSHLLLPVSSHQESDQSTNSSSENSSVGARGAPLSLGESNGEADNGSDERCSPTSSSDNDSCKENAEDDSKSRKRRAMEEDSDTEETIPESGEPTQSSGHRALDYSARDILSTKTKRVLSSATLTRLNTDAGYNSVSPKKMRSSPVESGVVPSPTFNLGPSAVSSFGAFSDAFAMRGSPDWSTDDEDLDACLKEELRHWDYGASPENSPVPLLTPPQSPITVKINGDVASMCEWPSNLVVDSVLMTAATETRPLSPTSLQDAEIMEERRLLECNETETSLTPRFRSIYVGMD